MMRKYFGLIILIAAGFYILTKLPGSPTELISPLAKKEQQALAQKLVDDRVFEENKHLMFAEPVSWARGAGKPHPMVVSSGYVVVDKNGDVVYALNPDKRQPPASLTKLMTAMVVLDTVGLDEKFAVPKEAVDLEPTILMVEEGEKIPVKDLLQAALITSANDAAYVLAYGVAEKLGGSPSVFVKLMNEKARNMGLSDTQFANPTGYDDPGQYSTARELAKLAKYALDNYPTINEMVAIRESSIQQTEKHKYYELPNWNALLGVYPGVDGVKIGYTGDAGHVTIVTSKRADEEFPHESANFMVVLLGTPDKRARDLWAAQLLNSAFSDVGIEPFRVTLNMLQKRSEEWGEQLRRAQLGGEE